MLTKTNTYLHVSYTSMQYDLRLNCIPLNSVCTETLVHCNMERETVNLIKIISSNPLRYEDLKTTYRRSPQVTFSTSQSAPYFHNSESDLILFLTAVKNNIWLVVITNTYSYATKCNDSAYVTCVFIKFSILLWPNRSGLLKKSKNGCRQICYT